MIPKLNFMRFQQIKPKDDRFKSGDRVRMKYYDTYINGEITIVREEDCKVMWDSEYDLAYWYYLKSELELIDDGEQK